MSKTKIYPYGSPTPLPTIQGQGYNNFPSFPAAPVLFTVAEVAARLHVSRHTALNFITDETRANRLKASWVGRRWLVTEESIQNFLEAQSTSAE